MLESEYGRIKRQSRLNRPVVSSNISFIKIVKENLDVNHILKL